MPYRTDPREEAPTERIARLKLFVLKVFFWTVMILTMLCSATSLLFYITKKYADVNEHSRTIYYLFINILDWIF